MGSDAASEARAGDASPDSKTLRVSEAPAPAPEDLAQLQKLESLGLLASGIAHDFNNLLAVVLGNTATALEAVEPGHPAHAALTRVQTAVLRGRELTQQLMAYAGQGEAVEADIDVNELVEEMADLLRIAMSRQVSLDMDLADPPPVVRADVAQLRQIVMNLITNASDAIGDRPGRIQLRTGLLREAPAGLDAVAMSAAPTGTPPYALIEVRDDGCGMTRETAEKVFDPFFSTKAQGRGLGLSATLGFVRGHGGQVLVESAPGAGTRFRVLFPALSEADERTRRRALRKRFGEGHGAILVVDDEDGVRLGNVRMLHALGFRTFTASGGAQAIEVYREHAPDVATVLLDLMMPELDGTQVLQALQSIRPDVRVILTTAYDRQAVDGMLEDASRYGFLRKPFDMGQLAETLREALQRGRAA